MARASVLFLKGLLERVNSNFLKDLRVEKQGKENVEFRERD